MGSFIKGALGGALAAMLIVVGTAGASHLGVFGLGHTNTTPNGATSGIAGNANAAVLFGSNSNTGSSAYGVEGRHTATSGIAAGVRGFTNATSASARGVLGSVIPTSPGAHSTGVRGHNSGTTSNGYGVFGTHAGSGAGVYGQAPNGPGVKGDSTSQDGVAGKSSGSGASGVFGENLAAGGYGVAGRAGPDGLAGFFDGNVQINGKLTCAILGCAEHWHRVGNPGQPAFQNGWAVFDTTGNWGRPAFYKDALGTVHLSGLLKGGTVPSVAFTLPSSHCPNFNRVFPVLSNNALGRVSVSWVNCNVNIDAGSNAWVSLDGITFREKSQEPAVVP